MSFSIDPHHASTEYLEQTFTGPRDELAHMAATMLDGTTSHVAILGASGSGKSHAAELLLRELAGAGWRVARVLDPCRSLASLRDLLAYIAAADAGQVCVMDDVETPEVDESVAALETRYRDTNTPLAVLLEDMPALLERSLRGSGEARRLSRLLDGMGISLVATSGLNRLAHGGRSLSTLFHELELPALSYDLGVRLLERHAAFMGDSSGGPAMSLARALMPITGRNPRTLAMLYQLARAQGVTGDVPASERALSLVLMHCMEPYLRRDLDSLSPQQGLVVARLALAPGPIAAAQLGRRCGLPTSHTTAILDVLLQRRLVRRVPGPGKRNLYALPDRFLRLFMVMREHDHAGAYLDALLGFYRHARDHAARRARFEERGDRFARALRNEFLPASFDLLSVVHTLVEQLGIDEHDPGNRVLDAFLEQPPSNQELESLIERVARSRARGAPSDASAPERAVSHVALAAHFLHRGACAEAVAEIAQALELAPNWSDLGATLSALRLASGLAPDPAPTDGHTVPSESRARDIVDICAHLVYGAGPTDAAETALDQVLARTDPDDGALFCAIAAAIPRRAELAERVLGLFDRVLGADAASTAFLGVAASYAFEVGRWDETLAYLQARHVREPLPIALAPASSWLAAMSGRPRAYARAASRLPESERARYLPGMVLALRSLEHPDQAFDTLAPLFAHARFDADAVDALFGALLWVRDEVEPAWLAQASALIARLVHREPEPYRRYREHVERGDDPHALCTQHPEMRDAMSVLLGLPAMNEP